MKRLFIPVLAFALAGCGAIAPTAAPTSAPQVVTVVVTQPPQQALPTPLSVATLAPSPIPTATEAPTEVPTEAATQTPQVIVVTATPQPGGAPVSEQSAPANSAGSGGATATATLPFGFGGDLFTSMSRSGSYFNLRCLPQDITFSVSTSNFAATEVDLYYRMEDLTTNPVWYSPWKNFGKMTSDKNGNFTINVNTQQLSPDLRAVDRAWFDYEFVGINKYGDVVGRSAKISKQVFYLKDCP